MMCGGDEMSDALLARDAPDERDDGTRRVDSQAHQCRLLVVRLFDRIPQRRVDSVAHHVNSLRIQPRVGVHHVGAHARTHRDDGIGVLDGVAFRPTRHLIATAELLGLPGPQRFEGVGGQDVWNVVQASGEMPGGTGVPGVRVRDVGACRSLRHPKIRREHRQRRIGVGQCGVGGVDEGVVSGDAHAVHVDGDETSEMPDQFGDMNSRTAVDLGWILPRHHRHPHGS